MDEEAASLDEMCLQGSEVCSGRSDLQHRACEPGRAAASNTQEPKKKPFHPCSRTVNARFAMEGVEVGSCIRSAALLLLRSTQDCMALAVYKPAPAGMLLNRTRETCCHVIGLLCLAATETRFASA